MGRLWAESIKKGYKREQGAYGMPKTAPRGADGGSSTGISSHADDLCPSCKRNGRVFCPHKPLLAIKSELAQVLSKQEVFGPSPPNVFVGHFGYPQVLWGPMVSLSESLPDNPRDWYGWNFEQIVRARSMQVRGKKEGAVSLASQKSPGLGRQPEVSRMLSDVQEAAMSVKPVDMEIKFTKVPTLEIEFNSIHQPMGASAPIEKLRVAENSKIPKKVDSIVDDGSVKAADALRILSSSGFDEHYLTKLLSAGILGREEHRKLTPTKWAITATDDMLAKQHMEKLRQMKQSSQFLLYSNEYLANKFDILDLPGAWEYEGFEAWLGPSGTFAVSEEYEPHSGRSDYAQKQGGGYYAARLGVCEGLLHVQKRQARSIVFREILPEYDLPVGVWEIRENVRHAFQNKPEKFTSLQEALSFLSHSRLRLPLSAYLEKSRMLSQTRLPDF